MADKDKKSIYVYMPSYLDAMWYLKEKESEHDEERKLQLKVRFCEIQFLFVLILTRIQLEEEIAMRAALGLPVPQIKREKKRLEENDLTVIIMYSKLLFRPFWEEMIILNQHSRAKE